MPAKGESGSRPQELFAADHEVDTFLVIPAEVPADISHQRPGLVHIPLDIAASSRAVQRRERSGMSQTVVIAERLKRRLQRIEVEERRVPPKRATDVEELFVGGDAATDHRSGQKVAERMVLRTADEGIR